MSTKTDALIQKAERGGRVASIREALQMTGDQFAALLVERAAAYGLRLSYDKTKVSRLEGGGKKVTVEEAAILAEIDPEGRSVAWLVFGRTATARAPQRLVVGPSVAGEVLANIMAHGAEQDAIRGKRTPLDPEPDSPTTIADDRERKGAVSE